jgi:hypothetical protein
MKGSVGVKIKLTIQGFKGSFASESNYNGRKLVDFWRRVNFELKSRKIQI